MRVLIIGASGHVGAAAAKALAEKHDIIEVSWTTSPAVDLTDPASIERLFEQIGRVDAIVSAFGTVPFKPLNELTREDDQSAFFGKILSQIDLVRIGTEFVNDSGSITLTTGITARKAIRTGSAASLANGALEAYVLGAAGEMPRGIRLNAVSPTVLESAPGYHDYFPGFPPADDEAVGNLYRQSLDALANGATLELD